MLFEQLFSFLMIEHFANAYKLIITKELEQLGGSRYDLWSIGTAASQEEFKDLENAAGFRHWDCLSSTIASELLQTFLEKGMNRITGKRKGGQYLFVHRTA